MNTRALRDCATDAIRFWERRRVLYNPVLTTIVVTSLSVIRISSKDDAYGYEQNIPQCRRITLPSSMAAITTS